MTQSNRCSLHYGWSGLVLWQLRWSAGGGIGGRAGGLGVEILGVAAETVGDGGDGIGQGDGLFGGEGVEN